MLKNIKIIKKTTKINNEQEQYIINGLLNNWSPKRIGNRMKIDLNISLHHETIYRYILKDKAQGGLLNQRLRHKNKPYRKRYGANRIGKTIPNRIDIDNRPKIVNERSRIGDWEADTIIGHQHKGAILTLDERKSKIKLAFPLGRKTANNVVLAMINLFSPLKSTS